MPGNPRTEATRQGHENSLRQFVPFGFGRDLDHVWPCSHKALATRCSCLFAYEDRVWNCQVQVKFGLGDGDGDGRIEDYDYDGYGQHYECKIGLSIVTRLKPKRWRRDDRTAKRIKGRAVIFQLNRFVQTMANKISCRAKILLKFLC